jgi:DNA-binding NarL/FixJ family response regulator
MTAFDHARPGILVQHSEPIFAAGLAASLASIPGFEVLKDTDSASVVICDYQTSRQFTELDRATSVVVIARKARDFEIQEAMSRGVLAYVVASCTLDELESAVSAAASGRRFLCQAAAREVANGLTTESLTLRERDVLRLLAQGSCNKTIANGLGIALGTVKAHVRAIMAKLKACSRTEAASIAVARGLLPESALSEDARTPRRTATSATRAAAQSPASVFA